MTRKTREYHLQLLCISVIIIIVQRYGQTNSARMARPNHKQLTQFDLDFVFVRLLNEDEAKNGNLHTIAYDRCFFFV